MKKCSIIIGVIVLTIVIIAIFQPAPVARFMFGLIGQTSPAAGLVDTVQTTAELVPKVMLREMIRRKELDLANVIMEGKYEAIPQKEEEFMKLVQALQSSKDL